MSKRKKKGQSTLEYIILVTAVIAVAIVFLRPQSGGKLYASVESSYNQVAESMNGVANKLANSFNEL